MASSKVMTSTTAPPPPPAANPDPPRLLLSSISSNLGSINMDDILKNIYTDENPSVADVTNHRTADEVWRDIVGVGDGGDGEGHEPEMTLEDFLRKAGVDPAVNGGGEVRFPPQFGGGDAVMAAAQFGGVPPAVNMQASVGVDAAVTGNAVVGRGKRRAAAVEEAPVDKATQQKQKRMIKNRESAARSRERKQAYTVELESLVTQLEEENARLLREEAQLAQERFKQLMENLIPVVEQRRPPRALRRMNSM